MALEANICNREPPTQNGQGKYCENALSSSEMMLVAHRSEVYKGMQYRHRLNPESASWRFDLSPNSSL